MTSEITWEHFRDSARVDRIAWDILLVVKMNGLAAYHMQQSVEKYLKAVIMKYELLDSSPKKLGHMPFDKILKEIEKRAVEESDPADEAIIREFFKCFCDFLDNPTDEGKSFFWKTSLGIKPTEEESKLFKNLLFKSKKVLKHKSYSVKDAITYSENRDFKSEYTSEPKHNAWLWISHSLRTLMFVFTHMEIGRYPTMIGGMLSTDVYKESPRIQNLEGMTGLFCREAEEILDKSA